ncbi:MAG: hypothetical protein ACQEVA_13575 [Myxococcota bacterium]
MDVIRLRTLALISAFVLAGFSLGCEKEEGNNGGIIPSSDTGTSDAGDTDEMDGDDMDAGDTADEDGGDTSEDGDVEDPDSGDTGDGGDGEDNTCESTEDCEDGEICLEGTCVTETAETKCEAAVDLGAIDIGETKSGGGDLFAASDFTSNSCANEEDSGEVMFRFTAESDGLVTFDPTFEGAFGATVEYRGYSCQDIEGVDGVCYESPETFFATAGTEYLVVVELDSPRGGDFTIDLSLEEGCQTGDRACSGDDLKFCSGDGFDTYTCAGGCSTSACAGDSCSNPIQVTGSATFSGDVAAYVNNYNFEDSAEFCSTGDGTAIPTPGEEVIFELPNLTAGQVIGIDTQTGDDNANAIFVSNNCGEPFSCSETSLLDEDFEWTAPADGTYYIIVDKQFGGGDTFSYSIDFK